MTLIIKLAAFKRLTARFCLQNGASIVVVIGGDIAILSGSGYGRIGKRAEGDQARLLRRAVGV
jgi:hypothetical protein